MANIKWTGIEQKKYGLTARWYVSAYYGNDNDVDSVGLYDPDSNDTGHGGPTRPFATWDRVMQESAGGVVFDSGFYTGSLDGLDSNNYIGDGGVIFDDVQTGAAGRLYNVYVVSSLIRERSNIKDSHILYSSVQARSLSLSNCIVVDSSFNSAGWDIGDTINNIFLRCSGTLGTGDERSVDYFINNTVIDCSDLRFALSAERTSGAVVDYSILIGTIETSTEINGKKTGVTIEDFKVDGQYFRKSYSEVDLFGNEEGSGANEEQLNEIFNNFFYPYIDDYHNADFTLQSDADDRVKFGGLNGTYIGAKPVGHRFSAYDLWNTHIDSANTSNLQWDDINEAIVLADGEDEGTYRSDRVSLPEPIKVDLVEFFANFVYNIEGTAKEGVANQRIDTTPDLEPDNTKNQRVVYDYRLQVAPNDTDDLSVFKEYELDREPTIDDDGNSQLSDNFDDSTEQKQTVQDFIIEFTLRRVIIE